jgi:Zn ribbon nucleic-acid-binding protein
VKKALRILRYIRCPRCRDDINAVWWSDNVIDCDRCGIYDLGDAEEELLVRR